MSIYFFTFLAAFSIVAFFRFLGTKYIDPVDKEYQVEKKIDIVDDINNNNVLVKDRNELLDFE